MTTGSYADAAGLVERSAAAYAAAVPVTPEDEGFFGPASVTWRVSSRSGRARRGAASRC